MSEKDLISDQETEQEVGDFGKKEQVLINQIRHRASTQDELRDLGEALGVADDEILATLKDMGYTRDTVILLHLVPLIQIAWASGSVTAREREMVLRLCEWRGVTKDSPAWQQLNEWLDVRPSDEFLLKTLRIIRHLLDFHPAKNRLAGRTDLISFCMRIAAASGGFLGIGNKISVGEREALDQIVQELTLRNPDAIRSVLEET